ncbi:MAG: tetratricopeptide repeat protein [Azoarcus sp.]|jgi:predicted O-linked N-acetylglucosamine transferase (SPINDLY family)|nr:tetratricopeptide repeat protein [Azoarcus sp.]
MHHLCHALNESGHEAYIFIAMTDPVPEAGAHLRVPPLTPEIYKSHQAAGCAPVAVYPEIIPGNSLGAPVVARWLLYKAKKPETFAPDELFFHFGEWTLHAGAQGEELVIPLIDRRIFNNDVPETRSSFCYYAQKYLSPERKLPDHIVRNGTSLCQDIRRSPRGIADVLRTSKVLYCYEPSAIAGEAIACGCPVIYVMTDYLRQFDLSSSDAEMPDFSILPEADIPVPDISIPAIDENAWKVYFDKIERKAIQQLERFIDITQAAAKAHLEKVRTPERMLARGIEAFQADHFDLANAIFHDLMGQQPQNPLPPAYLAYIAARQDCVLEARDFIDRAHRSAPDRADLQAALGEAFLRAGHPERAVDHLNEALAAQPDLLMAYPALAQGLCQIGQDEAAVSLLQSAACISSEAQAYIQNTLLAILAQRGDVDALAEACLEFSRTLVDDLRAARYFSCFESSGKRFLETLERIQMRLADAVASGNSRGKAGIASSAGGPNFAKPLKIAFMVGDFARERSCGRLAPLLRFRPPESFTTLLLIGDPRCGDSDYARLCTLLADRTLPIHEMEDAEALEEIRRAAPDILIDLEAYGAPERLAVFLQAEVECKLLWGEAPMPPLSPDCGTLAGARLAENALLPCVTLPGMGECHDFPEYPLAAGARADPRFTFGCLTPAMKIGREGWQLFAEILAIRPECQLLVNLQDLGETAQAAICARFARAGVAAERLRFVHAHTAEDFCRFWQEVDAGLAPPVDAGGLALPGCLWMGRPYASLASPLPWARRAAALLELVGAAEWIAETPNAYIERARQNPPPPNPAFRARMKAAGLADPAAFAWGFADAVLPNLRESVNL